MKTTLIFDLDGTLWDTSIQVVQAWNEVLKDCEDIPYELTIDQLKSYMGKTIEEINGLFFTNLQQQRMMEVSKKCLNNEQKHLSRVGGTLYPELLETLDELKKDYSLMIVSNCQEGYIETFLEYHQLSNYFLDFECAGKTKRSKGENILEIIQRNHIEHAIYIGDTTSDQEAALLANIPFIYASYGFGNVEQANMSIEQLKNLPNFLKDLFNETQQFIQQ